MFVVQSKNSASKFQQLDRLLSRRQKCIQKSWEEYLKFNEAKIRLDHVKATYHEVAFFDALKHLKIDFEE